MTHNWFDVGVAATYDVDAAAMFDANVLEATVNLLASLAGEGPALEFAIGTGRVALPLAARGIRVSGIELSDAMSSRLRAKEGGDEASVPVATGDMAEVLAPEAGRFALVYLVFNTITNLTSQESQVACFRNAARHLAPGGCFVVETFVPRLRFLPPGQRFVPFEVGDDVVGIDEYDVANQRLVSHYVQRRGGVYERAATPFRYVWPSELDLMAQMAGLRLRDRWADWCRGEFTSDSPSHVSVWEKPAG